VQTHPFFKDILMHSDDALSELLGVGITERATIHEWPLSCVQRLVLADGRKLIYKSQLPPTVEAGFYEAASSPLLPEVRLLGKLGNCDTLTIDWIDAPLLRDVAYSAGGLIEQGKQVIAQIGEIKGDLPVYLDIGSAEKWSAEGQIVFDKVTKLIQDKRFTLIDLDAVERVRAWIMSPYVIAAIIDHPRVTHGDLTAEQVFVTADGYRVIDWQRPILAPPEVDLVALLVGQKIDPRRFVDPTLVGIFWFLHLRWAVVAQFDLFPDKRWPLFDQWAADAVSHILG
jgi:hypothetical protein